MGLCKGPRITSHHNLESLEKALALALGKISRSLHSIKGMDL